MKLLRAILPLLLTLPVHALDPWTRTDTALEFLSVASICMDGHESENLFGHTPPGKYPYEESNIFLPRHPTNLQINRYVAKACVTHILVARLLPSTFRHIFQGATIALEADLIHKSISFGAKVNF